MEYLWTVVFYELISIYCSHFCKLILALEPAILICQCNIVKMWDCLITTQLGYAQHFGMPWAQLLRENIYQ